jgi:uncharacterized protein (UPF0210 family)
LRTITAFCAVKDAGDPELGRAIELVELVRARVIESGHAVQTRRIAASVPIQRCDDASRNLLVEVDRVVRAHDVLWTPGRPPAGIDLDGLPRWASQVIGATEATFLSLDVASGGRIDAGAARVAACTVRELARETEHGLGNFRFGAAAGCGPGVPFFPVAASDGRQSFAFGLESAAVVGAAAREAVGAPAGAGFEAILIERLGEVLRPLEALGGALAKETGWAYGGIDLSPAPGLQASIGASLEALSGAPVGSAGTLAACAAVTGALRSVGIRRCGYSGLMLPVLEDPVLAERATERRYSVRDLLLWSSVCGTGLDMVPLAAGVTEDALTRLILDVAAMSVRLQKPLSARLLPCPGARVGDPAHFPHPLLVPAPAFEVT